MRSGELIQALVYACGAWQYASCKLAGRLWPGVYFSPLGTARLQQVSPPPLRSDWNVVRVLQCGLCASDLHMIRLQFSLSVAPVIMSRHAGAFILGHEVIGVIEQSGAESRLSVGTRVISRSGGFRNCFNLNLSPCAACQSGEYALCARQGASAPAHEPLRGGGFAQLYWEPAANLIPVPPELSDDQAMLAEPLSSSLRAVLRMGMETGRVLIVGAGMQGLGAVHWIRHLYPRIETCVLARHRYQAEHARSLGAQQVFEEDFSLQRLADQSGTTRLGTGRQEMLLDGFDAVIDSIGTPRTVNRALRCIRAGGSLILLGAHLFGGNLDYSPIWFRDVRVTGAFAHGMESFRGRRVPTLQLAMELLAHECPLRANLVTHRVPLKDIAQAARLHDRKATARVIRIAVQP